uniref:Uncharacterized protein n=1 Tax=Magallana gigas TaxID=29159 RepID=A0A8W8ILT8_MAGGI
MSTNELHSTLIEMNKSIQLLHDEVKFLKTAVVLKSEVDESVYKTPTALTSGLEVAEESLDNTLTFPTSKHQAATELSDKMADQKLIIDRLTSVIPPSGFISDPFKGAKPKTSTPINRVLENADFQTISPIQPNSKSTQMPNANPKRLVHNEKPASEKQSATPISGSQTSQDKPSAVGSQTPMEPSRGRTTKKSKRRRSRSTSSSSSDNASSNWTRTSRSRSRSKSPQRQKMPVFKGSDSPNWESFIYQFERIAAHRGWSANKKAFRLLDCLGDVALEADLKLSNEKDKNNRSLDEQISHLTSLVEKLTTSFQQSLSRNQVRPSSPVPRGLHFEKNRSLSRSPARGQRFSSPTHSKSSNEVKGQPTGDLNRKGSGYYALP